MKLLRTYECEFTSIIKRPNTFDHYCWQTSATSEQNPRHPWGAAQRDAQQERDEAARAKLALPFYLYEGKNFDDGSSAAQGPPLPSSKEGSNKQRQQLKMLARVDIATRSKPRLHHAGLAPRRRRRLPVRERRPRRLRQELRRRRHLLFADATRDSYFWIPSF